LKSSTPWPLGNLEKLDSKEFALKLETEWGLLKNSHRCRRLVKKKKKKDSAGLAGWETTEQSTMMNFRDRSRMIGGGGGVRGKEKCKENLSPSLASNYQCLFREKN